MAPGKKDSRYGGPSLVVYEVEQDREGWMERILEAPAGFGSPGG
jgi:hypothetical protein